MPNFLLENKARSQGLNVVCGIDEAGRGPWAGPVVSVAAVLDEAKLSLRLLNLIDDSKKLNANRRRKIFKAISSVVKKGIGIAKVEEIDQLNILQATMLSMRRAVINLNQKVDLALVDGNHDPVIPGIITKCIVKGDTISLSIASASIIAKVTRDKIMSDLAKQYPGYGWERNAGYGTKEHKQALLLLGLTPLHRKSFKPIRQMLRYNGSETSISRT